MRRICSLFLFALSASSGCTLVSGFDDLRFDQVESGSPDGAFLPDSRVATDAGPDPMSDAEPDPDAGPDEDTGPDPDAFVPDAGPTDSGPTDGDSMLPDAFMPDADVPDSGTDAEAMDAGPEEDAFVPDAGPEDAGPTDSGPTDAGPDMSAPDSGPPDLGPPDTGPTDAGPPDCRDDLSQERCLIRIRFVSTPRVGYVWFKREYHPDGGPGMVEAWHVGCPGAVRVIDATTSECIYQWVPSMPGTTVTFVPGYDADTSACDVATCHAAVQSVAIYDVNLPMGAVSDVVESTPPVGDEPTHAFRITVPAP